jgi:hypothetical protein
MYFKTSNFKGQCRWYLCPYMAHSSLKFISSLPLYLFNITFKFIHKKCKTCPQGVNKEYFYFKRAIFSPEEPKGRATRPRQS